MKKCFYILKYFLSVCIVVVLVSCTSSHDQPQKEDFKEQIDAFSESLKDIDEAMNMVDMLNKKLNDIEKRYKAGELTEEEAARLTEEINHKYSREIARRSNLNPAVNLPQWAKNFGLTEPQGLKLDEDFSQQTSIDNPDEGYNSVILVYNGSYEKAMEQAKIIAEKAGIPLSKNYKLAFEMAEKYGESFEEIKGITYMNYDFSNVDVDLKISISVSENGVLTINAVDVIQMNEYLKKNSSQNFNSF
jgi:hypothetical protein